MLTIVNGQDNKSLIQTFYNHYDDNNTNVYISDWKVGYYHERTGAIVDAMDFNLRTVRTNDKVWRINERENLKRNPNSIEKFSKDYDFDGKECVIVSAGPSLDENISFLRDCKGKKLIIAVNTVLRKLRDENIVPDVVTMLSPDMILREHIEGVEPFTEGIPLVMPLCGSRSFTALYKGPLYVIDQKMILNNEKWDFGGTVTSLALNLAYNLNATKIFLVGSDLAFTGGKNFSRGVAHGEYEDINNSIWVDSSDGGKVQTNNLYNNFREIIEKQIADKPGVVVVNMAKHGAKIAGTIVSHL